ncbi:aspartate kinase [Persicobacter psychrovividus]|uniref:Aspartokinase n=1 Tax=Persicobacter psychrovividus TaxID=387638 RepID=A0ABM7VFL7_9BACT|nr:aspartokinase [Persicobacter psychrovividus]
MKVFKFGGASIKDAHAVKNMTAIIADHQQGDLLVVVSAMGKMTNALERVVAAAWDKSADWATEWAVCTEFHEQMLGDLFADKAHQAYGIVRNLLEQAEQLLTEDWSDKHQMYDAVVSYGELLSSAILNQYLKASGIKSCWMDARKVIKTDDRFQEARISWGMTEQRVLADVPQLLAAGVVMTQGFIGSSGMGATTTLAREGSDFSAAIFGNILDAESVTIWKDVPGILNADPKRVSDTIKFEEISYQEAAEMTFYGASVIHPKTIKPLADKNIPLLVRSFEDPQASGTTIGRGVDTKKIPNIIFKDHQCLMTFSVRDLAFLNENNLSIIFHLLDKHSVKINMLQSTALSLSICFDNRLDRVQKLIDALEGDFKIAYQEDLQLITLRNYTPELKRKYLSVAEVVTEQRTPTTFQLVTK